MRYYANNIEIPLEQIAYLDMIMPRSPYNHLAQAVKNTSQEMATQQLLSRLEADRIFYRVSHK